MYRIIDSKGTGKTSRLLLLAKENDGIVVCAYPNFLREKAYAYGLTGIDFLSYNEFITQIKDNNLQVTMTNVKGELYNQEVIIPGFISEKPVFVDDLEALFNKMCFKFSGYTLNMEK